MIEAKYPRSFPHIGITVPDIEKAVEFYSEVIGWYVIRSPSKVKKERDTAIVVYDNEYRVMGNS